jgi:error-prone DNA polymerase
MTAFAELAVTTNFSFLRGGSHPEELIRQAQALGLAGMAITDRNTLAGIVRGHVMAKALGTRYAVGCRLAFRDGTPDILAWPADRDAYGRLCRLLTEGNRRAPKGECHLDRADLLAWGQGIVIGVMPGQRPDAGLAATLGALKDAFPGAVRLMASRVHGSGDARRLILLDRTARRYGVPLLATNDVLYHTPERRPLQDVVTCIREHVTLATAGRRLAANAERHLKDTAEMGRLFRDYPEAVAESRAVLERLSFSLDQLRYIYPDEPTGDAASPEEALERLTGEGARLRYPDGVPEKVRNALAHELAFIRQRDYAAYFLTVHDIVRFARDKAILCQGRGSAANSAVCFCLGITEVNPETTELLFERFMSPERNEPPDIDVDFEHERREEVMQYIFQKYSRERAGIAATVITYRTRSAVREVGKVFGLSEDAIGALASTTWGWSSEGVREADARRAGLDPKERTLARVLALSQELIGFPRHLSQHVGGFVITRDRLDESVPVMNAAMENRTNIEWDKDDLDAVGMMKVDVLALGMLSCIRRAFDFMRKHYGHAPTLATIGNDDPAVYAMLQRADSLGVFQVESRAQMSMLPRLKPMEFYDLVIEVAIVRPGPIQGDMVHPYLLRREGKEKVRYPSPSPEHGPADELERVLGRTLGVPLFQEQAMKIAMVAAKFTAAEADKLRRAMATFKRSGTIGNFHRMMVDGMVRRGYDREFAERCFHQIEGFGEYGFPESHAASFALLVYASAWLKCHYPDVFCAALINSQPMGFYAPAQIVRDTREHGIDLRAVDVNLSDWDCTLEGDDPPAQSGGRGPPPKSGIPDLGDYDRRTRQQPSSVAVANAADASEDPVQALPPVASPIGRGLRALATPDLIRGSLGAKGEGLWRDPRKARGRDLTTLHNPSPFRPKRLGPPAQGRGPCDAKAESLLPPGEVASFSDSRHSLHPNHAGMRDAIRSTHAVRLGLRQIKGFSEDDAELVVKARGKGYDSVRDLWLRSGLTRSAIERLADADAFRSLGLDRRDALWAARELGGGGTRDRLPLFDTPEHANIRREPDFALPPMPIGEHVVNDYRYLSLSLKAHPASFLRDRLAVRKITANQDLRAVADGRRVSVAGLVLIRQRPGTAKGVIFMTIEDETGIANAIVWPKIFERFRPVVLGARFVAITGKLQSASGVIHVVADRLEDLTPLLSVLSEDVGDPRSSPGRALKSLARADEAGRDSIDQREKIARHPRMVRFFQKAPDAARKLAEASAKVMPKGRNFH